VLFGRSDQAIADGWKAHYELLMPEVRPFPSAAALVREVAAADVAVVLATSSPAAHVSFLVDLLGLGGEVAAVTTADDAERSKPDPEIFLTAMSRAGGDPSCTVVVGDSTWDVEAATAARLPCVAVESGGFSDSELVSAGAVAVYADVEAVRKDLGSGPLGELMRRA